MVALFREKDLMQMAWYTLYIKAGSKATLQLIFSILSIVSDGDFLRELMKWTTNYKRVCD